MLSNDFILSLLLTEKELNPLPDHPKQNIAQRELFSASRTQHSMSRYQLLYHYVYVVLIVCFFEYSSKLLRYF